MNSYSLIVALLVVFLGSGQVLGDTEHLKLETGKSAYWRYELVDVRVSLPSGSSINAAALPKKMTATVWRGGQRIKTVGGVKQVNLYQQPNHTWQGKWPIPFNPRLGTYQLKIQTWADGVTLTAKANFKIKARQPYQLKPGFSVVTYEGGKKGPNKTPGVDSGDEPSWRNMVYWAEKMGADAFWQCIGQTQVWGKLKEDQYPWSKWTVRLMNRVGKQVHEAGLEYGAWITSFVAIGNQLEETGYEFTQGYDRKTNTLKSLSYISLGSQKRLDHMVALLKKMNDSPYVDYIGLDYMRTDFGGYEFADEFVRDMDIAIPDNWTTLTDEEKSIWVARLIEIKRDKTDRTKWNWWRAHKVGLTIVYLLDQVKPTKPVWVFSLGWKTGHQHGQDMLMMLDAGIGFNAPMFYSITRSDYPHMLTSWRYYLNRAKASVVIGQCVDHNLLGKTTDPASPLEHLDRQEQAIKRLEPAAASFGLFWHDMNRAFFGARGPYHTQEWVMAGAVSFTQVKAANNRFSFDVNMTRPDYVVIKQPNYVNVGLTNTSSNTVTALAVSLVDMPRLVNLQPEATAIDSLAPGERRVLKLGFVVTEAFERNGSQQMVAIKVDQIHNQYDPYYKMVYLPVLNALPTPTPTMTPAITVTPEVTAAVSAAARINQ